MSKKKNQDVIYVDEDGNPIELEEGVEYEFEEVEVEVEKKPSKLNSIFHYEDRGGSLGSEILAGIGMGLLAVCVVFMNMQIIGDMVTADVTLSTSPDDATNISASMVYATLYAGSILVSILGTIAIGIVANLPLVQVTTMGLTGALLCLVETGTGLSIENVLFVNFIAGVLYAVIVLVPGVRTFINNAIPSAIRRGLPVAAGLMFAWMAIRVSGFFTESTVSISGGKVLATVSGVEIETAGLGICLLIGLAVAIVLYVVLTVTHKSHPVFISLIGGTLVYLLLGLVIGGIDTSSSDSVINFGRIWLVAGSQSSDVTPFADSYLTYCLSAISAVFTGIADVFTEGADFSAYSGNVVTLIISGVLCYLFGALLETDASVTAVAEEVGVADQYQDEKSMRGIRATNAVTNAVAPLLGTGGVSVSEISVAGAQDHAKSGLSSIVAAIVLLISLFVMAFPAVLATDFYPITSMNAFNYFAYGNGGFVYLVRDVSFAIADVVMACVGIKMVLGIRKLNGAREIVPAIVMAVVAALTLNIVAAVALGLLVYIIMAIPQRSKDPSALTVPMIVLDVILIVAYVLL